MLSTEEPYSHGLILTDVLGLKNWTRDTAGRAIVQNLRCCCDDNLHQRAWLVRRRTVYRRSCERTALL